MIEDNRNYTRYNTEDVNKLLERLESEWGVSLDYYVLAYASSKEPTKWWKKSKWSEIVQLGDTTIRIASPSKLMGKKEYQLEMIARPALPSSVTQELVQALAAQERKSSSKLASLASEMSIRIMDKSCAPKRVKLTNEQRIERLLSDSFYGSGGRLKGCSYSVRSGTRADSMMWRSRIGSARVYYERELAAKQKHENKLRQLGVEPIPYESFADYLRRMADSIEKRLPSWEI